MIEGGDVRYSTQSGHLFLGKIVDANIETSNHLFQILDEWNQSIKLMDLGSYRGGRKNNAILGGVYS